MEGMEAGRQQKEKAQLPPGFHSRHAVSVEPPNISSMDENCEMHFSAL
jgi:hypothetical protein